MTILWFLLNKMCCQYAFYLCNCFGNLRAISDSVKFISIPFLSEYLTIIILLQIKVFKILYLKCVNYVNYNESCCYKCDTNKKNGQFKYVHLSLPPHPKCIFKKRHIFANNSGNEHIKQAKTLKHNIQCAAFLVVSHLALYALCSFLFFAGAINNILWWKHNNNVCLALLLRLLKPNSSIWRVDQAGSLRKAVEMIWSSSWGVKCIAPTRTSSSTP